MTEPERTATNLTGTAADSSLPVTSRSSAVALIDEGNALEAIASAVRPSALSS